MRAISIKITNFILDIVNSFSEIASVSWHQMFRSLCQSSEGLDKDPSPDLSFPDFEMKISELVTIATKHKSSNIVNLDIFFVLKIF